MEFLILFLYLNYGSYNLNYGRMKKYGNIILFVCSDKYL